MHEVPARALPVPTSISPEAQAMLAIGPLTVSPDYPAPGDLDGWRAFILAYDEVAHSFIAGKAAETASDRSELDVDGVPVYVAVPEGSERDDRVVLDMHGGALVYLGGEACRDMGVLMASLFEAPTWSVDYRMPPDHPYPAALDDCIAAYRRLLDERPSSRVVVNGASAGANLAAALVLRARDEGLPLPAAVVLQTPELDLTESGDSFQVNAGVDTVLSSLLPINELYAGGHDLAHPYLSPVFGDMTGCPPTILTSGTRDLFLSNTVRMHRALRRAGVDAELHVLEAAPHGGFLGAAPEDADLIAEIRRFFAERCPAAR